MKLFQNILVPFDLSNQSTRAFKTALEMATKFNSKITLLTCVEGDAWHHKYYDSRSDSELLKNKARWQKHILKKCNLWLIRKILLLNHKY